MGLARDFKAQFVVIATFAFLATGADLLQPLIYKRAITDVAGLFVGDTTELGVPARSANETLRTLMISVIALFVISVVGYFCTLRSRYYGARVASHMEASFIVRTFGHVLRLPLSFFSHTA